MNVPLIEIKNLRTRLQGVQREVNVVDGIDLCIEQGETLCLLGESGSGKSMTALSILRLLPQSVSQHPTGEILFACLDKAEKHRVVNLLDMPEPQLRELRGANIAMVFQEPMTSLNPVLTIGEQIAEAISIHNPDLSLQAVTASAIDALKQVQIEQAEQRLHYFPHQLSGGQRQRVMIAMAIACKPDLLIVDEPTSSLDVTVQAEILNLLRKLQQRSGMSILFITHDLAVVAEMADRVAVMRNGKIVEQGELQSVFQQPQHPYTRSLLDTLPQQLLLQRKQSTDNIVAETADELIRAENLKVCFQSKSGFFRRKIHQFNAVDEVDISIRQGEIVALVGESGSGKTTLGHSLLRLTKATSGSIYYSGKNVNALCGVDRHVYRQKLQIIFQDPMSSLNPRLKIATILTEPMQVHGIGRNHEDRLERAAIILQQVQLPRDALWRYPHEFSGGQKQRIGLARALVLDPELIVCDEVTSALDVSTQADILQLLIKLRDQQNMAILFITHDFGIVEYMSDRTIVMHQGKIVETGETAQVCQKPRHDYTRSLLAAVPGMHLDYQLS